MTSTQGVVVTTDLGSSISMSPGTPSQPTIGILAQDQGVGGSGGIQGVTVTVGGTIAGANIGVEAAITNGGATTNPNNVTVQVNNSIDAITTGVIATTAGTGNVYVGSSSAGVIGLNTQPNQFGVNASITNAGSFGNVTVNLAGAVTAATGISAVNVGSGNVSVTASGGITAIAGNAVFATSVSGNITVDTTGNGVSATDTVIYASSSAGGNVTVKTDAVTTTSAASGIIASSSSGSVTVQTNGAVSGAPGSFTGIDANSGGGTGAVSVTREWSGDRFRYGYPRRKHEYDRRRFGDRQSGHHRACRQCGFGPERLWQYYGGYYRWHRDGHRRSRDQRNQRLREHPG